MIVSLQIIVFRDFYTGSTIPPYDFLGAYATEAFAWWTDGGFFEGSDWVPYVWGGYPSAIGLQNSSWYLPTGLISAFGPYTLHKAAILAALHVAFGSIGMYFLLRAFRSSFEVSLFASVAAFFAVGYFSNASHIDIARAYAWAPWVLLILTPLWPWRRWWSIPLATLLIWQALTGIYPGTAIASVYVLVPWVIASCRIYLPRFKAFLLPLTISAFAALLLSMPRLLPYLLLDDGSEITGTGDSSSFSLSMLSTILFGYGVQYDLPNDVTMRSLFVPATVIVLSLFARWSDPLCKAALSIGVPALLLGMPFLPWFTASQSLPGLGLSRFTMSDYKVFLVVAAILLAASGLRSLTASHFKRRDSWDIVASLGLAVVIFICFALLAIFGPQDKSDTIPQLLLIGLTLAITVMYVALTRVSRVKSNQNRWSGSSMSWYISAIIVLTAASGINWAFSTPGPWRVDRVAVEEASYGATVDSLIAKREADPRPSVQRPAREPVPAEPTREMLLDVSGNAAFYSGDYSLAGYVNLKRSASHKALEDTLISSEIRHEFAAFMAVPGTIVKVTPEGETSRDMLINCVEKAECGVDATPISYSPGFLQYQVSVESPTEVMLNESYYPGWFAAACMPQASCQKLHPELSKFGTIQLTIPSGSYDLSLRYTVPGLAAGWGLFGVGLMLVLGTVFGSVWASRHKKESENDS